MKRFGVASSAIVLAGLGMIAWTLGARLAFAMVVTSLVMAMIAAWQCRAELGQTARRTVEEEFSPIPIAPGATLVAIVCPDELVQLPELIVRASATAGRLVVLVIEPGRDNTLELPRPASELLRLQNPEARSAMAEAIGTAPGAVTFITASSTDAATVTLDVARRIAAREVFALSTDAGAAEADAERATRVWQALPSPKAELSVRLVVAAEGSLGRSISLAADLP